MENTKFFKTVEFEGTEEEFYSLFVCHKDTPIPTAEEIVARNGLNECCKNDKVIEITREEFLTLQANLLASIIDSVEDARAWAPNLEGLTTWEFWENEENI